MWIVEILVSDLLVEILVTTIKMEGVEITNQCIVSSAR